MNTDRIRRIATTALACAVVATVPSAASAASFQSAGPAVEIPDQPGGMNPGASESIDVPAGYGQVAGVRVSGLKIQHERVADLFASLIAPNGQKVSLMEQPCEFHAISAGQPFGFADTAAQALSRTDGFAPGGCAGTPDIAMNGGTFRAVTPLASLNGQAAAGRWTVNVLDDSHHKSGQLVSYGLELDTTATPSSGTTPAPVQNGQPNSTTKKAAKKCKRSKKSKKCKKASHRRHRR